MLNFTQNYDLWTPVYANTFDPWNPKLWARESIAILEESMIYGSLIHRDFNNEIASFGDIVNTRKPAEFTTNIYTKGTNVTYQDASAANVQVKLDTVADVSFLVYDIEQTYSFADLVTTYLQPAILTLARTVDRKIAGQAAQFLANTAGGMGTLSKTNTLQYLVETEQALNEQKVSDVGRNLVVASGTKANILMTDLFVSTEKAGTDNALRRASLGGLFGMETYMSLNTPSVTTAPQETPTTTSAKTDAGDSAVSTVGAVTAGAYFTIAGDMTPLRVLSTSGTYDLVTTRPIREATSSGAAVTIYSQGAVDFVAGYAAGYVGEVHVDGLAGGPHVGQLVSFGSGAAAGAEYVIVQAVNTAADDWDLILDRGLDAAISDNDVVNYGPVGSMNPAFHRNAIALVNRPLEVPNGAAGANIATASSRNISVRVATSWDQDKKALKVSVDSLFGVKTLDAQYGVILLG